MQFDDIGLQVLIPIPTPIRGLSCQDFPQPAERSLICPERKIPKIIILTEHHHSILAPLASTFLSTLDSNQ